MSSIFEIIAERNSPSDEELICVSVPVENGVYVNLGKVIFEIEGAKAIFEILSETDGYFYSVLREGESFRVGQKIGFISKEEIKNFSESFAVPKEEIPHQGGLKWDTELTFSQPALKYLEGMAEQDTLISKLDKNLGLVTVGMLKELEAQRNSKEPSPDDIEVNYWRRFLLESQDKEKCLFIGGGYGAVQTLDLLAKLDNYVPVGFLSDSNENYISQFGLPFLGDTRIETLTSVLESQQISKIVLTVGSSPDFRMRVLALVKSLNLSLVTLIHPTVILGSNVSVGEGSLVFANVHIGTGSKIGEACFISSNSSIEHHNTIGQGFCTGPNLNTSGGVAIGKGVRFGMNISIEPGIRVGDGCIVASGVVLTRDLKEGNILKSRG